MAMRCIIKLGGSNGNNNKVEAEHPGKGLGKTRLALRTERYLHGCPVLPGRHEPVSHVGLPDATASVLRHANGSAAANGSHGGWESSNDGTATAANADFNNPHRQQAISVAGAKEEQETQEVSTDEGNAKF
jgi:hypothetical protein